MPAIAPQEVERLAWQLCDAEKPLTGATKFDRRPCPRHIEEAHHALA